MSVKTTTIYYTGMLRKQRTSRKRMLTLSATRKMESESVASKTPFWLVVIVSWRGEPISC
jgi:hypothetical protein